MLIVLLLQKLVNIILMKFTEQQLLDSLKGKLTENGKHLSISEKTIKSLCDAHFNLLVKEDTELDDLVKDILPMYVSLNGNYEKDNADFIKKWNKEHTVPTENKKTNGEDGNPASNELTELINEVKALKEKEAQREIENLVSHKKSELLAKFKEKGIKDEKWVNSYMKKLTVTKDSDIEQETKDALDFYNLSHVSTSKRTPGVSGYSDKEDKEDWSDVVGIINPDFGK